MALVRTSRGSWDSGASHGTGSYTTGSFTPSANSLLTVIVCAETNNGSSNISASLTITDSAGLTWTAITNVGNSTSWATGMRAWRAPVGASPSSMTVTVDCGANNIYEYLVDAIDFTGYDTSSPIGATATGGGSGSNGLGADGAASITLSAAPASSSLVIGALGGDTSSTGGVTYGTGWTELYDVRGPGEAFLQVQERTGSTSTTVGWNDICTSGTAWKSLGLAFEVKAAASGIAITPGAGTLTLAGFAPSANRTAHQSVAPGSGAVVLTGAAPSVSVTSASVLTPASGALTLAGSAPGVTRTAHQWRLPDAGAVTLAGAAPSVAQTTHRWLTPGASAVVLTGATPEVAVTQSGVISPAAGGLTLTGHAPSVAVTQSAVISPAAGALTLTGYAPTLAATGNVAITPAAGVFALVGAAPGVARTAHRWLTPGAGAVVIGGAAPSVSVSAHRSIVPGAGALTLTGYAPNFAFTSPVIVPASTEIVITGYAPNVIAIRPNKGAGKGGKGRRRVVIRERVYEVSERDIPALIEAELLDRAPPVTAEVVAGPKPPRKRRRKAAEPVKTVEQVREVVQQIKARIEPDNAWLLQALESVAQRVLERLQDEEDSLMLLLAA